MVDILVAHSYFLKYDPKQRAKSKPYPPLGTLYAAAILRQAGYSVALFDAMFSEGEGDFARMVSRLRPRFVVLYEDSFNFLVKMCLTRMREAAQCMSDIACDAGATVIAAGPDVSDRPGLYFNHGVRYALLGEADHTLIELLDALDGRAATIHQMTAFGQPGDNSDGAADLAGIPGLAWSDLNSPDGVYRTTRREPERHLDCLPFPAWDMVDAGRYRDAWQRAHGYFSVNLVTTRGCPFHCNWCAKPIWGQRYAIRSPRSVAEEMALLKRTLRPDHLWFADDIFGLRGQWVAEFGREVAARDAAIPFTIQSRVDLMTEKTVAALAQAGCREVWLGAESGSQKILDAMDKGVQAAHIPVARERLRAAGIRACFFIQFGYPSEAFEDILATVEMVRATLPDDIGVSVSYPLPGTRFHSLVREELGAKTNWQDSGDLAMMFQGAYASQFYRCLHHLLHHDLDLRKRLIEGPVDTESLAALDRLHAEWLELGRLEVECRNESATPIRGCGEHPVAPDLSEDWN